LQSELTKQIRGFTLKEVLHTGELSTIYSAVRNNTFESVILKILRDDKINTKGVSLSRQEFDLCAELDHPNIIRTLKYVDTEDVPVIVMEDFGGRSLSRKSTRSKLTLEDKLNIAIQATAAIAHIHQSAIIHRDVCPANFIYNPQTKILKLIDFGFSIKLDNVHQQLVPTELLDGTLLYMSPEQTGRMNRSVDYRTDIYSLGVTLYELFVGYPPFEDKNTLELMHSHIAKQAIPAHMANLEVPSAVGGIIEHAMEKDSESRYQTAKGMLYDLERCLELLTAGMPIKAFPVGTRDQSGQLIVPERLYGRETQMASLIASFGRLRYGAPEVNIISGYSGMGKTSLVRELFKRIGSDNLQLASGKFDQLQKSKPYSAIVQAFSGLTRQYLSLKDRELKVFKERLLQLLGDEGQMLIDVLPEVELIIGKQPPMKILTASEQSKRFNYLLAGLIKVQCSASSPLVLFIDDLQWADHASLDMLEFLLVENKLEHLFFIGAYRSNEVDESHRLTRILRRLEAQKRIVNYHRLEPLNSLHVNEIVTDTIKNDSIEVGALAREINHRTQGNPFFVNEFITSLYDNKLLTYNHESAEWQWLLEEVQRLGVTENVADLVVSRIQKLPDDSLHALKLASCIGAEFDLETLSVIADQSPQLQLDALQLAIQWRLISPKDETLKFMPLDIQSYPKNRQLRFMFLHDRIQQTAYSLIGDDEKEKTHLMIGRRLLDAGFPREQVLFAIVDHLNIGAALIDSKEDQVQLAQLNYTAGQKAQQSAAFQSAFEYYECGTDALGEHDWETDNELLGDLYSAKAEAIYLTGDYEACEVYSAEILSNSNSIACKTQVLEILASASWAQNQARESVEHSVRALALTGLKIPKKGTIVGVLTSLAALRYELHGRTPEDLLGMPITTNPDHIRRQGLLFRAAASAFAYDDKLFVLLFTKMIISSLRDGYTEHTATAFSGYAIMLYRMFNKIDLAYRYGKLSMAVSEKLCSRTIHARNQSIFYSSIAHYNESLHSTLEPLLDAYEKALEGGDAEFATLSLGSYCWHLRTCEPSIEVAISRLKESIITYERLGRALLSLTYCKIEAQVLWILSGDPKNTNPLQLTGSITKEQEVFSSGKSADNDILLCHIYGHKGFLALVFKNYRLGYEQSSLLHNNMTGIRTRHYELLFTFWDSINITGYYPNAGDNDKSIIRKQLKKNLKFFKRWGESNDINYRHYGHASRAEWYRINGDSHGACNEYNAAIAEVKRVGWIQDEAIITERFAAYCFELGWTYQGNLQMQQAYRCYQRWGAHTKLAAIEKEYPRFKFCSINEESNLASTSQSQSNLQTDIFDVTTVIQSSQVLTSATNLEQLVEKLLDILLMYAGADKASLLLKDGDLLTVEAVKAIEDQEVLWVVKEAQNYSEISYQVVSFVARSLESVVIDDVFKSEDFSDLIYTSSISADSTSTGSSYSSSNASGSIFEDSSDNQALSVVCFPLVSQDKLVGIAYLENRSSRGAFLPSHLDVLKVVASQAAIAIEKSNLYDALAISEEKFRGIIENADIGIFQADLSGHLLTANQGLADILGYDSSEYLLESRSDIFYLLSVDTDSQQKLLYDFGRAEILRDYQLQAKRLDGSLIYLSLSVKTISDAREDQEYLEGFIKDVTARTVAENFKKESEAAKAASKSKSDFLANMSHEIRTPLNGVIGITDLLTSTNLSAQQKQYTGIIKHSGETLLSIINNILDLSKIESGKMELEKIAFDVHQLLVEMESLFKLNPKCESAIHFSVQRNSNVPQYVLGDPIRIRQVITNLLSNAFKFTANGFINLQVSKLDDDSNITFEVVDSGVGLSDEAKESTFLPYSQAEKSTTRLYGGTGLGLDICKKIITMMNGDIGVVSEIGKGATFWFTVSLPETEPDKSVVSTPYVESDRLSRRSVNVLVAEDNKVNQIVIQKMLDKLGAKVVLAENGEQAFEMYKANETKFDLVLMDCEMPVMGGCDATRLIRAFEIEESIKPVPIVALTANVMPENYLMCFESGMNAHLTKPLQLKYLKKALLEHILDD